MTLHDVRKYLFDVVQACDLLMEFTKGKTLPDYSGDPMLRSAVERQFEIIGEALNKALGIDPALSEKISDTNRIISFRNRLIHGYADISDEMVWGVIETNLPILHGEVKTMLEADGDLK